MDNELDRRLARIEKGIEGLRQEIERQTSRLSDTQGLIVDLAEVLTKPVEGEGEPLGALLQRLISHMDRVVGVSEATMAAVKKIADRLD
jgi:hypothetical protein